MAVSYKMAPALSLYTLSTPPPPGRTADSLSTQAQQSSSRQQLSASEKPLYLLRKVGYSGPVYLVSERGGGSNFTPPIPYLWSSAHAGHLITFQYRWTAVYPKSLYPVILILRYSDIKGVQYQTVVVHVDLLFTVQWTRRCITKILKFSCASSIT